MGSKNYGLEGVASTVQLGKGGARVKNSSGIVEFRDASDMAYAVARGGSPSGSNDLVPKGTADLLPDINGKTEKTVPIAADIVIIEDSAAVYAKKKVQLFALGRGYSVEVITVGDTLDDTNDVVVCNGGAAFTLNLPACTGKHIYKITNIAAYVVTLDANGTDQINEAGLLYLGQWDSVVLIDVGTISGVGYWIVF